jgi:hypothetical protein
MPLFKVTASGSLNGELIESYFIVNAVDEDGAEDVFNKTQPRIDPEFSVKTVDIELLTEDDVLVLEEEIFS